MNWKIEKIEALALDVDGVLSDGKLFIGNEGEVMKAFHVSDGMGVTLWRDCGFKCFIITGRNSVIVQKRAGELNIDEVMQGVRNKKEALDLLCRKNSLDPSQIAYIGDDLNDLPAIACCGYTMAPAQAVQEVKDAVDCVLSKKGGEGAVREAIEMLLKEKKQWHKAMEYYLKEFGSEENES